MEEEKNAMAPKAEQRQTVVMYPSFGAGHIIPMTKLANVLLRRGLDVTIVLIERPFWSSDSGAATTRRAIAANPAITFHFLPPDPSPPDFAGSSKPPFFHTLQLLRRYNGELARFLRSFPLRRLHSVVTGMFSTYAAEVAAEIGVPAYTFFASGAGFLAVVAQLPALLASRREGLRALGDAPLGFAGVPPIPASHLVKELLEHPEEDLCSAMVDVWRRIADMNGVVVNTFESLERRAVEVLGAIRCGVGPGKELPPVYCVGPIVGDGGDSAADQVTAERRDGCLSWLDAQPERSVVYLCFGSRGTLPAKQLREIAAGLERSGHRFLWVVRAPAGTDDPKKFLEQRPEPELEAILPAGFLERTHGRGLVVASWAPQAAVLRHPSAAAFVTHCGWNSVLEAVAAGVPMLCWPLYSEQMLNKVLMTDEGAMGMGIAVEMEGYAAGFVGAEEVERKVRLVMESEEGRKLRKRVAARRGEAEAALREGGSSRVAFDQFLADVEKLHGLLGS
jgi:UDP-N-acetylglucosamine:LPS N-acetylglucosamine transferase